jgi:membrane-bound lytic murein transglycosylase D
MQSKNWCFTIKASRAAAKLLRLNYDLTGAWPLAITAYNHGVGGIRRATQAVDSHDIADLIDKYHGNQFGFASKNFYSSFLGVLATLKDADRLFPEVPRVQPLAFSTIKLSKPISVREICRRNTVSLAQVAQLNPDISPRVIRSESKLPTGFVIKIPASTNTSSRTFASSSTSR